VDRSASHYPYSDDGAIAVPAQADWLDPLITLAFAAAASSRIAVATGVLLLPEHNPVVVAKQAASLDRLSGGRLTLGIGVGGRRRNSRRLECHSSTARRARPSTSPRCARCGATTSPRSTGGSSASTRSG
jgi:alkanesulfonate monooxygenase SsuD/methylene tetrahydromethanopterin reductase-like flavin-dependent oxidoreductase (luciferase family)